MRVLLENLSLVSSRGLWSRFRILFYRMLGLNAGKRNRMEAGRCRCLGQIQIGSYNAFTEGYFLWPENSPSRSKKIVIGDSNYFNRNLMIDACSKVVIGNRNMFGPDVYITDSNHAFGEGKDIHQSPMKKGTVIIGNNCWVGAKAVILMDVELGDNCVVGAGAIVTKSVPSNCLVVGVPARVVKKI